MKIFSILFKTFYQHFPSKKHLFYPVQPKKKTKQFFCIQCQLPGFFLRGMWWETIFKENKHPCVFIICWQQRYTINMFKNNSNRFLMINWKSNGKIFQPFWYFYLKLDLFPRQILFFFKFCEKNFKHDVGWDIYLIKFSVVTSVDISSLVEDCTCASVHHLNLRIQYVNFIFVF